SKSLLPTASNSLAGQAAGNLLGNLAGQNGLPDDNSESSQTLAVISPATITLTGTGNPDTDAASQQAAEALTQRDAETANQALTDTLTLQDAARIERQMQEAKQNAAAANLIGQTVAGLIGDLADQMKKPINDATLRQVLDEKQAAADKGGPPLTNVEQYELNRLNGEGMSSEKAAQTLANPEAWANYDNWQEGSLNKTILHGLAGIIQAKVGDGNALVGAAAGALNEALLPEMEKFLDAQNITDPEARKGYLQLGSALLGAGLGAVADGTNGAALGGTVAHNATTYNYLSHPENKERAEARKNCASGNESACQRADELDALDRQRDTEFHAACDGALRATEGCKDATRLMLNSVATYFPKQDEKIYLPDDFLKTAHQDELQSYRDLLQAANDKALQNGTDSQRPDLYNSDLYGVVDPNSHDLYVMVKIGDQWNVVSKTDKVFTSEAGVNGILNDSDYAPGLLGYHIDKEQERQNLEKPGIYTLFYNPTGGFLADGLETFQDKLSFLFGPSEVAKKLSGVLGAIQQDGKSVNWVAHSQGGAIFASAVDYYGGTLSNNSVAFHAGANNQLVTDSILKNAGMNFDDKGKYQGNYWNSPNDAVPNIIGLNTINPITWVRSILFIPTLFMGPESSPHTLPPKSDP
ncbi:MAG: hypothetical protein RBS35_11850, partial [Azonexus sp.]|nr:hypothetical protein [Azonexus sp.]